MSVRAGRQADVTVRGQAPPAVYVRAAGGGAQGPPGPPGPQGPPGPGNLAGIQGSLGSAADLPAEGEFIGESWIVGPLGELWIWK